MGQAKLFSVER